MRIVLAIAMATFTLGLASQPMHGQMPTGDAPALNTIYMLDALAGWAVTVGGAMLRTTSGGIQWTDVTPLNASGQGITVVSSHALTPLIAWAVAGAPSGALTSEI